MRAAKHERCQWVGDDPMMIAYHDTEWGVPIHDDQALYEKLTLDMFQAGLSWRTILHRREGFLSAFDGFDAKTVAGYGKRDVKRLLADERIIRNRLKVESAIHNAGLVVALQATGESLSELLWSFTEQRTLRDPAGMTHERIPASSPESIAMTRELKKRGFRFLGPTILYAFMQAVGMVDDHVEGCFRYVRR